jgi:hypothetical protein
MLILKWKIKPAPRRDEFSRQWNIASNIEAEKNYTSLYD